MANDTTIWLPGRPTGLTVDTWIWNSAGQYYNPTAGAYQTYNPASLSSFNNATPETPSGSGNYACTFPVSASPLGRYHWRHTARLGASPASTDPQIGQGSEDFDGATFGTLLSFAKYQISGTVQDTSPTAGGFTVTFANGFAAPQTDVLVSRVLAFTGGGICPDKQQINGYVWLSSTTARLTFNNPFAGSPANGDPWNLL